MFYCVLWKKGADYFMQSIDGEIKIGSIAEIYKNINIKSIFKLDDGVLKIWTDIYPSDKTFNFRNSIKSKIELKLLDDAPIKTKRLGNVIEKDTEEAVQGFYNKVNEDIGLNSFIMYKLDDHYFLSLDTFEEKYLGGRDFINVSINYSIWHTVYVTIYPLDFLKAQEFVLSPVFFDDFYLQCNCKVAKIPCVFKKKLTSEENFQCKVTRRGQITKI